MEKQKKNDSVFFGIHYVKNIMVHALELIGQLHRLKNLMLQCVFLELIARAIAFMGHRQTV